MRFYFHFHHEHSFTLSKMYIIGFSFCSNGLTFCSFHKKKSYTRHPNHLNPCQCHLSTIVSYYSRLHPPKHNCELLFKTPCQCHKIIILVGNLFSKKLNITHKETLNLRSRHSYSISNPNIH
jgi:hypothetical protein